MIRSIPPEPRPPRNIRYPDLPCQRLPNGLTLVVVQDCHLPKISLKLAFPAGLVDNPDDNEALVPLTLEMFKEGTQNRSAQEIAEFLDYYSIHYHSEAFLEYSLLSMSFLEEFLRPALEILADLVRDPSFPEAELEKVRVRWRSHLLAERAQPSFLARERLFHTLYEGHPYSKVSIPPEHLERVDRSLLQQLHGRLFGPSGALLILAGRIDPESAHAAVLPVFGDWPPQEFPRSLYPDPPQLQQNRVCLVHRPHSRQVQLLIGRRTIPKSHPDYHTLNLANQVLGGSASARLFLNLREEKGYTYGAYSVLESHRRDGAFLASTNVRTEVTATSIREVLKEMEAVGKTSPRPEELQRAKAELSGAFLRRLETPASIASLELTRRLYDLPDDYYQNYLPRLQALTAEEVGEAAGRYLSPQGLVITVVGERSQLQESLSDFGDVEIYDVQGQRVV